MRRKLLGLIVLAQVASPRVPERPATAGIVSLMTALAVTAPRGRARSALAAAAGVASEVAGVRTGRPFGPYHYTSKLGPGIGGVPFAVGACWAMMAGPSWAVAVAATDRRALRPLVAAGAMTAWDVALDPRMVREGYWVWARPGRYEGIPLSNFAGWLVVGGALFGVWSLVDAGEPDDEGLALYAWSWVGEMVANVVFWRRPRVAAAAGAAMGAFAVPAVRRRLGR